MVLARGEAYGRSQTDVALQVVDGTHDLILEVKDTEGRKGRESVEIHIDEANFIMDALVSTVSVTMTVSHNTENSVSYSILDSGSLIATGTVQTGTPLTVPLSLTPGTHRVQVKAQDSLGRGTYTFPVEVEVT